MKSFWFRRTFLYETAKSPFQQHRAIRSFDNGSANRCSHLGAKWMADNMKIRYVQRFGDECGEQFSTRFIANSEHLSHGKRIPQSRRLIGPIQSDQIDIATLCIRLDNCFHGIAVLILLVPVDVKSGWIRLIVESMSCNVNDRFRLILAANAVAI